METVFINPFLLAGCAGLAWLIMKIYDFTDKLLNPIRKNKQNDIFKYKCKKLHDKAFFYYYNLMINNPEELAYDLASKDLNRVIKEKRVSILYDELVKQA